LHCIEGCFSICKVVKRNRDCGGTTLTSNWHVYFQCESTIWCSMIWLYWIISCYRFASGVNDVRNGNGINGLEFMFLYYVLPLWIEQLHASIWISWLWFDVVRGHVQHMDTVLWYGMVCISSIMCIVTDTLESVVGVVWWNGMIIMRDGKMVNTDEMECAGVHSCWLFMDVHSWICLVYIQRIWYTSSTNTNNTKCRYTIIIKNVN